MLRDAPVTTNTASGSLLRAAAALDISLLVPMSMPLYAGVPWYVLFACSSNVE